MITFDDVLNLNYYKKTSFSGWVNGMRFLIKREVPKLSEEEEADGKEAAPIFHAWVWPGPFIFDLVEDDKKIDKTAEFSDAGKQEIVDWLNQIYLERSDLWSTEKKILKERKNL